MESVISLFFLLGPRGDAILFRDFRGDPRCPVRASIEDFLSCVTSSLSPAAGSREDPVFALHGTNFIHLKRGGMYFVCATRHNASPSLLLEFLNTVVRVFKDFAGALSEDAFRANFLLLYELLDEMVDAGYIQQTGTAQLKHSVRNEPELVMQLARRAASARASLAPTAACRPVTLTQLPRGSGPPRKGGEIFIDVLEALSAVFSATGQLTACSVEGSVLCKSFLTGQPWMRMVLAQELVIGKQQLAAGSGGGGGSSSSSSASSSSRSSSSSSSSKGALVVDDVNFHACVNTEELEGRRLLTLQPPEGEFTLLSYRASATDMAMPFKVVPHIEEPSACRVELFVRVVCEVGAKTAGHNVTVRFHVPQTATTVWPQVQKEVEGGGRLSGRGAGGGSGAGAAAAAAAQPAKPAMEHDTEYIAKDKCVRWTIKKMSGGCSATLRTRISLSQPSVTNIRKSLGPITLEFEVPDYSVTKFKVRRAQQGKVAPRVGGTTGL